MNASKIFSTQEQLDEIQRIVCNYARLPFALDSVPGAVMEGTLEHVRKAKRLNTYDFVDVVNSSDRCGWQVKSTKASTPVTWKRAKIPDARNLIVASESSQK